MRNEIYSEEYNRFREAMKRQRIYRKIKQSDLAKKTGRSQAYISKFEKGDLRLDVVDFLKFCHVLRCDPVLILQETMPNFRAFETTTEVVVEMDELDNGTKVSVHNVIKQQHHDNLKSIVEKSTKAKKPKKSKSQNRSKKLGSGKRGQLKKAAKAQTQKQLEKAREKL